MRKPWPHPLHFYWAIIATVLDLLSLILSAIGLFVLKWFYSLNGTSYTLLNDDIYCYEYKPENNTFCTTVPFDFCVESTWPVGSFALFLAGVGLNGLCFILIVFVFWPLARKDDVLIITLKVAMFASIIAAYLKFAGCWWVVHYMTAVNESRVERRKEVATVEVDTLPLAFIFTAFILEIAAVATLKVTVDVGVKGEPTHRERLQKEAEEMELLKKLALKKPRRSTYCNSTVEEHKAVINRVASVKSGTSNPISSTTKSFL